MGSYCKDHLEGSFLRQAARCRQYADWRFTWLGFGSYIPRLMHTVAAALDADAEAVERAEVQWRRVRAERGMPVYTGSGVDLTTDEMDVNGNILSREPDDLPREAPARSYEPRRSLVRLSTEPHPPL